MNKATSIQPKLRTRGLLGTALAGMAALGIDLRPAQKQAWELRIAEAQGFPRVCPYCAVGCDTMVYVKEGAIVDIARPESKPLDPPATVVAF